MKTGGRHTTPGGGGPLWRLLLGTILVLATGLLVANVVWSPSKRNLELLAAAIFLAIVLVAHPFKALLFCLVVIPYPAYTSVGSTSMLLVFAVAALALMKSREIDQPGPFVQRELDLALLGFLLMSTVSWYSQPPAGAMEARLLYIGLLSAVALFYLIIYLVDREERLWQSLKATQFVMFTLSIIASLQYFFPERQFLPAFFSFSRRVASMEVIRAGDVRVMATFNGQELYAEYVALCIVLQYVLFRNTRGLTERIFWAASIGLLVAALFMTATRGAFIVTLLGFFYLLVVGARVIPRGQLLRLGFVVVALFYLSLPFTHELASHLLDRVANIGMGDSSVQHRSVVLEQAWDAFTANPWLGHGMGIPAGTFRGGVSKNIHNLYLTLGYTIGLPGLIAFLWFISRLWRNTRTAFSLPGASRGVRELSLALNACLVMFLVDQVKIEFTRQPLAMHVMFTIFAWCVVCWRLALRSAQAPGLLPDAASGGPQPAQYPGGGRTLRRAQGQPPAAGQEGQPREDHAHQDARQPRQAG